MTLKEKEVLSRISRLICRKLRRVVKARSPDSNLELPVKLTELAQYVSGSRPIPVCDLVALLKFWGCSEQEIAQWNLKISILTYFSLKKARGERTLTPPELH